MFGTYQRLGLHVFASNREVIRAARKKILKTALYVRDYREARHQYYRSLIQHHVEARELYLSI